MSWHTIEDHFDLSTYLQELEEESSLTSCLGTELSELVKSRSIPETSSSKDSETESFQDSQSGTTSAHSTGIRGEDQSISSQVDSLAKTSAQLVKGQESTESVQDYGQRWQELYVKYDRDSSSWKTHLCLWEEVLPWYSVTLPKWGIMQNGELLEVDNAGPHLEETGCGSLPAPIKGDFRFYRGTVWGLRNKKNIGHGQTHIMNEASEYLEKPDSCRMVANPAFWEEIMAFPHGWTDLKPSEMHKIQSWLRQHSEF